MILSPKTVQRLGRSFACALVAAAAAVPIAQASGSRDKYGPLDPWAYRVLHQARDYGPLDPWANNIIRRNSFVAKTAVSAHPLPRRASSNSFDWADAAVGAGGTLGLMLLTAGTINTVHRSRRGTAAVGS
jgi:hypothetical protein